MAWAEETTCRGSLGAVTVDNLRVPQNASCTLGGTRVQGTIKVENGASLTARRVRVTGDILFDSNTRALSATRNQVGGDVQAFQNTGGVTIRDNTIANC